VGNDENKTKNESYYSHKVNAGKRRTYFFDVRKTKGDDYYVTLTESNRRFDGEGYDRHKIFLYKEDFNRFIEGLEDVVNHIKTELMPDYDYKEFDRRYEEDEENNDNTDKESVDSSTQKEDSKKEVSDEEMSW
jgi:hypothetical protein